MSFWQYLSTAAFAKAALVTTSFLYIQNKYDMTYCNPHCSMRIVNETDPAAYAKHPFWKDLHYDESCAGQYLQRWVTHQVKGNDFQERYYMELVLHVFTYYVAPPLLIMGFFKLFQEAGFSQLLKYPQKIIGSLLVAYMASTTMLMHTHYDIDIIYMAGGVYHHALASQPGIDDKNNNVNEGYVICGSANRILYSIALYFLIRNNKFFSKVLSPELVVGFMQITMLLAVRQVGKMHPIYHDMAKNGSTPEMDNAWPYTHAWRAFKHCITHHDNGYSFSGDLFLDPVWDAFLNVTSYLYNHVFHIALGSTAHYAYSTLLDAVMLVMAFGCMNTIAYAVTFFLGGASAAKSSSGKTKSA